MLNSEPHVLVLSDADEDLGIRGKPIKN